MQRPPIDASAASNSNSGVQRGPSSAGLPPAPTTGVFARPPLTVSGMPPMHPPSAPPPSSTTSAAVPSNAFSSLRAAAAGAGGAGVARAPLPTASSSSAGSKASPPVPVHSRVVETKRGKFAGLQFGSCDPHDHSPVVVYLHGAGMSSWGYTLCASALYYQSKADGGREVRGFAYDLRCHGGSTSEGGEESLTMDTLVDDTIVVIREVLAEWYPCVRAIYLVGHSLGGAIVANVMAQHKDLGFTVAAAAILDVVEGTAKQSLQHMRSFLDRRPKTFAAPKDAVKWFLGAGGIKNSTSAELSVPHLLVREGDHDRGDGAAAAAATYRWRTDLMKTLPNWDGWFDDLDNKFLAIPCPKMLCLAVTDRLDKALTIGHMMGKFQLEVVGASNNCGHYVMEDCPEIVSGKLLRLIRRIDTLYAKLPVLNHQAKRDRSSPEEGGEGVATSATATSASGIRRGPSSSAAAPSAVVSAEANQ